MLPGGELWLQELVANLVPTLESLGGECVFLSEGPAARELGGTWIELNKLDENPGFRRLATTYPDPVVKEKENDREIRFSHVLFGKKFSSTEALSRYVKWMHQARALFRLTRPDMVWVWNGMVYCGAAFAATAKEMEIPVMYAEKGVMPGSWALDPQGTNGASSLPGLPDPRVEEDRITAMKEIIRQWDGGGDSAWEQPGRLGEEERTRLLREAGGRKVLFFPGQVDSDSNIVCFSPHFSDSLAALEFLVRNLGEEYFFLVKPHPKGQVSGAEYRTVLGTSGLVEEKIHVLDAIALSDLVVSINSTVAFEAAIRGKPVFLLGLGILSGRSFVAQWNPEEELASQVAGWVKHHRENSEKNTAKALSWAGFLHKEYYLFLNDIPRLTDRIKKEIETLAAKYHTSRLEFKEIDALCGSPEIEYLTETISGRKLLKLAVRRFWNRLKKELRMKKGR